MFSWLVALTLYLAVGQASPALALADFGLHNTGSLPLAGDVERMTQDGGPVKSDTQRLGVEIDARAGIVLDWDTGKTLYGKNSNIPMPVASITKLVTALVVLDSGVPLDQVVTIQSSDSRQGGIPYVIPGEEIYVRDLLHASLVPSGNGATAALARSTGLSEEEFAARMNEMAARLEMNTASFVEPTGLNPANVASARDVAKLVRAALRNDIIQEVVTKYSYEFDALTGLHHSLRSTDMLLQGSIARPPYTFLGGKTGYLDEAGYCFGAAASNADGNRIMAVALGAQSKTARFDEVSSMMYWAFDVYDWPR